MIRLSPMGGQYGHYQITHLQGAQLSPQQTWQVNEKTRYERAVKRTVVGGASPQSQPASPPEAPSPSPAPAWALASTGSRHDDAAAAAPMTFAPAAEPEPEPQAVGVGGTVTQTSSDRRLIERLLAADLELNAGTRLSVPDEGEGTYVRFIKRKKKPKNKHVILFDGPPAAEKTLKLKGKRGVQIVWSTAADPSSSVVGGGSPHPRNAYDDVLKVRNALLFVSQCSYGKPS